MVARRARASVGDHMPPSTSASLVKVATAVLSATAITAFSSRSAISHRRTKAAPGPSKMKSVTGKTRITEPLGSRVAASAVQPDRTTNLDDGIGGTGGIRVSGVCRVRVMGLLRSR
jgi:hypothetical protein